MEFIKVGIDLNYKTGIKYFFKKYNIYILYREPGSDIWNVKNRFSIVFVPYNVLVLIGGSRHVGRPGGG